MSQPIRLVTGAFFLFALTWGALVHGQAPAPMAEKSFAMVDLKDVTWSELGAAIRAQRGHIVVVDFWADYCIPCKQGFPHLVDLQRRYAGQGVVCVTVSLDQTPRREAALAFLKAQNAALPNYRLSEPSENWEARLGVSGIPAVFVFDRDGSRVGKFDSSDAKLAFTHDNVEALVKDLLANKP
jgi:thiol-disulfide isomerase/thioredoxin